MNSRLITYLNFLLVRLGFMSWCLVIPFDTMKTIVQAEIDPIKHGDMAQLFKTKSQVASFSWNKSSHDQSLLKTRFTFLPSISRNTDGECSFEAVGSFWCDHYPQMLLHS